MEIKELKQLHKIIEDMIKLDSILGLKSEDILVNLDSLETLIEETKVYTSYLIFDLEATNRELKIAKNIIEEYRKNQS